MSTDPMSQQQPLPLGETHAVENIGSELQEFNLITSDTPLMEAMVRDGAAAQLPRVADFGATIGTAEHLELGYLANRHHPELETHDRFGRRVDQVNYHPAYHALMRTSLRNGLHSLPWTEPGPGANVARGAMSIAHTQVEAGHGCPVTMTFASLPSIRAQPEVAAMFADKILTNDYDPRNVPIAEKSAITVGMGMTEKQGGSDVRANSTRAEPLGSAGPGELYGLTGHKWFLSAPMCDLFLVLAQAPGGLSCFCVPRWLPDGQKNPLQVIRLKDKMGNRSNASSEVEFRGARGWLVGEEGRGVPTIIEMVSLTRFDCMGGSAGLLRAGVAHAIHHCRQRQAFGRPLIDQPLMRNVLADLALEYEGAVAFCTRMARALDQREHDAHEAALARLATAVGKYWICKRAPQHSYEVMECIGGSGVMENSIFPRLYREAVINPIWEGSGNVQCLDVLRAVGKAPRVMQAFLSELDQARGRQADYDAYVDDLQRDVAGLDPRQSEAAQFIARDLVERMALAFQAGLLICGTPAAVAEAFCQSRLRHGGAYHYGALPRGSDVELLIARADPASEVSPAAVLGQAA